MVWHLWKLGREFWDSRCTYGLERCLRRLGIAAGLLEVVVDSSTFSIQLWWEVPPRFSVVIPVMEVVAGMAREDDEGTSRVFVRVSLDKPMEQLARGCVSLPEGRRNRVSKGRVPGPARLLRALLRCQS